MKVRITGERDRSESSDDGSYSYDNHRSSRREKERVKDQDRRRDRGRERERDRERDRESSGQDVTCYICQEKGHKFNKKTVPM